MDSNRLPFIESAIIYWFDAEYNTIMDERLQAIVIGEQSDLSLSIWSISSADTELQENDTLPTCELETSEDVTLPETFLEQQLEGTELEASRTEEKTREGKCDCPLRSPLHSSTPMKRTVRKAKQKAKPSQKSPLHVAEEVAGLEAPTAEDRRKDLTRGIP